MALTTWRAGGMDQGPWGDHREAVEGRRRVARIRHAPRDPFEGVQWGKTEEGCKEIGLFMYGDQIMLFLMMLFQLQSKMTS